MMSTKKILIVDDEEKFAQLVKFNLELSGNYEVSIQNKGKDAISTAKELSPDLIFLDIIMPDANGVELMRQMKGDPFFSDIPIVFLSALSPALEGTDPEYPIGDTPYLVKPVTKDQLLACLECQLTR